MQWVESPRTVGTAMRAGSTARARRSQDAAGRQPSREAAVGARLGPNQAPHSRVCPDLKDRPRVPGFCVPDRLRVHRGTSLGEPWRVAGPGPARKAAEGRAARQRLRSWASPPRPDPQSAVSAGLPRAGRDGRGAGRGDGWAGDRRPGSQGAWRGGRGDPGRVGAGKDALGDGRTGVRGPMDGGAKDLRTRGDWATVGAAGRRHRQRTYLQARPGRLRLTPRQTANPTPPTPPLHPT